MSEIRLANKMLRTLVKDRIHYPGRLLMDVTSLVARCGTLLLLYSYVFGLNSGTINGTTFLLAAWSMFFYFAFSSLRFRGIALLMMQDIQSGAVEILFSRPISYLRYRMWWQIGSGLFSFVVVSLLGSMTLALTVGFPETMGNPVFLPTLVLVVLFGSLLSLLLYAAIGLLAFWIEDINPIFWIVDKLVMLLGGSYLPIALLPTFMYQIALFTPFGASQFITHTVYPMWQSNWYVLISIQAFWVGALGLAVWWLFGRARRKVSVNGG